MKKKVKWLVVLMAATGLVGCGQDQSTQYNELIYSGLDYLVMGEYTRAEVQFQQALNLNTEDIYAKSLVEQSALFNQAQQAYEAGDREKANTLAERVTEQEEGSQGLIIQAEAFIQEMQADMQEDSVHEEAAGGADAESISSEDINISGSDETDDGEVTIPEVTSSASADGFYVSFEGAAFESDISSALVIDGDRLIEIIPSWNEMIVYDITSMTLDNHSLVIDYEPSGEDIYELGPKTYVGEVAATSSGRKTLLVNGVMHYLLTDNEIGDYGFDLP